MSNFNPSVERSPVPGPGVTRTGAPFQEASVTSTAPRENGGLLNPPPRNGSSDSAARAELFSDALGGSSAATGGDCAQESFVKAADSDGHACLTGDRSDACVQPAGHRSSTS